MPEFNDEFDGGISVELPTPSPNVPATHSAKIRQNFRRYFGHQNDGFSYYKSWFSHQNNSFECRNINLGFEYVLRFFQKIWRNVGGKFGGILAEMYRWLALPDWGGCCPPTPHCQFKIGGWQLPKPPTLVGTFFGEICSLEKMSTSISEH